MALRRRGFAADAIDLPVRKPAEDAVPAPQLATVPGEPGTVGGGQSYGGRVASLAAAQADRSTTRGLVLFCYPLHRPGQPDGEIPGRHRTGPGSTVRCCCCRANPTHSPGSTSSGRPSQRLPNAELVTYPKAGARVAAASSTTPSTGRRRSFVCSADAPGPRPLLPPGNHLLRCAPSPILTRPQAPRPSPLTSSRGSSQRRRRRDPWSRPAGTPAPPVTTRPSFGALPRRPGRKEHPIARRLQGPQSGHGRAPSVGSALAHRASACHDPRARPRPGLDPLHVRPRTRSSLVARYTALNTTSGAYGKYQIIPSSGRAWADLVPR